MLQIVPSFRMIRTVQVLGTLPSLFGMAAASHILCKLAGQPINPDPLLHLPVPQYEAQLSRLQEREELKHGSSHGVGVDLQDVCHLAPVGSCSHCAVTVQFLCSWACL